MKRFLKRIGNIGVAAALVFGVVQAMPVSVVTAESPLFSAECEDLEIKDATVTTDVYGQEYPGYTGDGFVWVTNGGTMTFTVDAPNTGMYRLMTKCIMYLGNSGESREAQINVTRSDGSTWTKTVKISYTDTWNDYSWGDIKLIEGENTITFGAGWGYCLYDSVELTQTPPPDYSKATDTLIDAEATSETVALMKYLKSVYGSHIISGQQEIYGGGNDGDSELEFRYIEDNTGKLPAIRGFDFMNYNPLYGWEDGTTERVIQWVKNNPYSETGVGIATASWHINVPIDFENYEIGDLVDWTKCTYKNSQASNGTFDTKNAVIEGTKEYEYFQMAMEDLAEQLKILQDNNVPIILRPLHEAQGNEGNYSDGTAWFWWGDDGPEVYKELWKLLYTTLTDKYNLHNIIWEYNSYNYANSDTWYPGDEYVDIVAYDKYNCDYNRDDGLSSGTPNLSAISSIYNYLYELIDGEKMLAISENDSIPSVENLQVENAGWLYFCPWYGDHLMASRYNSVENLSEMYNSEYCITLDELPVDLYSGSTETPETTTTVKETTTTVDMTTTVEETTVSAEETTTTMTTTVTEGVVLYGDVNQDGRVDITDAVMLNKAIADTIILNAEASRNADCYLDNELSTNDAAALLEFLIQLVDALPKTK